MQERVTKTRNINTKKLTKRKKVQNVFESLLPKTVQIAKQNIKKGPKKQKVQENGFKTQKCQNLKVTLTLISNF